MSFPRLLIAAAIALAGCSSNPAGSAGSTASATHSPPAATPAAFTVTSTDLAGGRWPKAATCDGADEPPALHWTAGPAGTASYALQVFDPDAPNGGFIHWMLANETPNLRQPTPGTGVSGRNDFGVEGYNGPCPPQGATHHYVVTVFAVDGMLPLQRLYRRTEFQQALAGHILAQVSITATYSR